jgi:putative ABC transport system ATP-binding protein
MNEKAAEKENKEKKEGTQNRTKKRRTRGPGGPTGVGNRGKSGDTIITGNHVEKIYDTGKVKVHALRDVTVNVKRGEMVSIMGPSGCGKTTLLNCFSGIDDASDGTIIIEGKNLAEMSDNERSRHRAKRMGFIFQTYNLLPVLTAVENVELPLLVTGVNPKVARKKAKHMLEVVGLKDRTGFKPTELSGGEQQRVTIARSLVNDPAIIWADEPTGNLDAETSSQIMDLLCKLNRENKQTFVVVSHDPAVGERGDRVLKMRDGRFEKEYVPVK